MLNDTVEIVTSIANEMPEDMSSGEIQALLHMIFDLYGIPAAKAKELTDEVHVNRLLIETEATTMN